MNYNDLVYIKTGQMLGKFIFHREDKKTILIEKIISNDYVLGYGQTIYEVSENSVYLANSEDIKKDFDDRFNKLSEKLLGLQSKLEQSKSDPNKERIKYIQQEIINTQKNIQKLDLSKAEDCEKMNNLVKSIAEKNKAIKHLESKGKKVYKETVDPLEDEIKIIKYDIQKNSELLKNILRNMK